MSVDSSRLTGIFGLVIAGLLLVNRLAIFFMSKSPLFSTAFLPNLSPACEIPDCSAFLANGLTTVLSMKIKHSSLV